MRTLAYSFLALLALATACATVPVDTGDRLFAPQGVIEGTVVYQGPHPCSSEGHIVGNAILLFFDKSDPPPPEGVASTAVNFGVVAGDNLFANEPRFNGPASYCPLQHGNTGTLTVSAPFSVSPFVAGTYIVEAFFDYTGDFLPTFKFRELPEKGDIGGGYIDTTDALKHAGDINYEPIFLPIPIGVPATAADMTEDAGADAAQPGSLVLPASGYVANNVTVSMGEVLPLARPYFYPKGGSLRPSATMMTPANPTADPDYVPIATMAQDIHVLANPPVPSESTAAEFQASFLAVTLEAGVPPAEVADATSSMMPFHFQLSASVPDSLFIWSSGSTIPENTLVQALYPQVVFTKLIDDPMHAADPQSITQQSESGMPPGPVVVLLGITLDSSDSIFHTALNPQPSAPGPTAASDHVTALVRPTAVCLDPNDPAAGATLVTPFLTGTVAGSPSMTAPLFDQARVTAALKPVFGDVTVKQGCLPTGRYAINLVYPTGQAWTVPNESGSCAASEGMLDYKGSPSQCSIVPADAPPRPVLYSQGTRGVVEIVPSTSPTCMENPVPPECLPKNASP
jgi:hypothetical protein